MLQADDRRADLHRHVDHLTNLVRVTFGQRAAEDAEILAEHKHETTVDGSRTFYDAIARKLLVGHAEVGAIMLDEHVEFLERVLVEQNVQPLACRQSPFGVSRIDALLPAADPSRRAPTLEGHECPAHQFDCRLSVSMIAEKSRPPALPSTNA